MASVLDKLKEHTAATFSLIRSPLWGGGVTL